MDARAGLTVDDVVQRSVVPTRSDEETRERDLLEWVRDGDVEAYGELYRRHHAAVERLDRRLCRDRHEADDVVRGSR